MIEKVQEKAVGMVTGLKGTTYEERCAELGLETLQCRRDRQDMILVHKYLAKEKQNLFTLATNNGGVRTRQAAGVKGLQSQFSRTDIRKHSFAVRTIEGWNKLPNNIRNEAKTERFKDRLKKEITKK